MFHLINSRFVHLIAFKNLKDLLFPQYVGEMARDAVRGTVNPSFLLIDPRSRKTSHIYRNIHPHLVYFPGVLAGLPFGKLTGERDGFVSAVGLFDKQIIINIF